MTFKDTVLTDDEIDRQIHDNTGDASPLSKPLAFHQFARAIEAAVLAKLREQEPVAYGMPDTQLGRKHRLMMVRLDKGQDGCTLPLYAAPLPAVVQASQDERAAFEAWWKGDLLDWRGHKNTAALHAWEGWQARAFIAKATGKQP